MVLPPRSRTDEGALATAGKIEMQLAELIADVETRQRTSPSHEGALALEELEREHARVLELLLDLQRDRLPKRLPSGPIPSRVELSLVAPVAAH